MKAKEDRSSNRKGMEDDGFRKEMKGAGMTELEIKIEACWVKTDDVGISYERGKDNRLIRKRWEMKEVRICEIGTGSEGD